MKKRGAKAPLSRWELSLSIASLNRAFVPRPGLGLSPIEELFSLQFGEQDELGFVRDGIQRLAKGVERKHDDGTRCGSRLYCVPADAVLLADLSNHGGSFLNRSVQKRTLLERLTASAGGDVKSRVREVSSRKGESPAVGLMSGGRAPAVRLVPLAEGILDGIGTSDTGASALQRAAGDSRKRRTRLVEMSPSATPELWGARDGQVDTFDFAWKCERPVPMGYWQRPYFVMAFDAIAGVHRAWQPGGEWHMKVPCRKCWPCQLERRREWIARAINEARLAPKTWFFTGTFRVAPETPSIVVDEYQRFLKRLRKKHKFRFLAVLERGERNGRMHVHLLLHGDLKYRDMEGQWTAGFMQAKLVKAQFDENGRLDADSARQLMYVAGYVTGDISFKVKASIRYGRMGPKPKAIPFITGMMHGDAGIAGSLDQANDPRSGARDPQERSATVE